MYASTTLRAIRSTGLPLAPAMRLGLPIRPQVSSSLSGRIGAGAGARRWNTQENKGGRAKLIFRFGLKDIPVELYPMAFVVGACCAGAAFAVGRHFYLDGLRLAPAGKRSSGE